MWTPNILKEEHPIWSSLRIKKHRSTTIEFDKNCAIIKKEFLDKQYKEETLDEHIKTV